jgi:hypothetical protein
LATYHGKSLIELDVVDLLPDCFYALALAPEITNLRTCSLQVGGLYQAFASDEQFTAVSEFFARNTSLETLNLGIPVVDKVLGTSLKSLHLNHLSITDISDDVIPDSFWPSISSQASSLETLILDSRYRYFELSLVPEEMLQAICLLHKLKILTISAFYPLVTDEDVGKIVENCPDIEEFSLASPALSDLTLHHLSKLHRLVIFNTRLVSLIIFP